MEIPTAVLLVIRDRKTREAVFELIDKHESVEVVAAVDEPIEAVQTALATSPDVAVVGDCGDLPWSQVCNMLRLACPECRLLLLTQSTPDAEILDAAMLTGVRQVVGLEGGLNKVMEALKKIESLQGVRDTREFIRATDPHQFPRIIAISGAKGGVGKTTVAANLGVALAAMNAGRVAVWDGYAQFGDIANIMGLHPVRALGELTETPPDKIDEELVMSYAIRHDSGADVFVTCTKPLPFDCIGVETAGHVMRAIRRHYRFLVVDTPPLLDTLSRAVFANCWRLLLITTLKDVTSLLDAMQMIQQLEPDYVRGDAIEVIANRVAKQDTVKEAEVESLTAKRVALMIPEDSVVSRANNLGQPVCQSNQNAPAARAIARLAAKLIESASTFGVRSDK